MVTIRFCRAMRCISAAYVGMQMMQCLSVCPSVRLSVTFVDHVKTNKHIFQFFSPSGSHTILVFPYQTGWRYNRREPPERWRRMQVGYRQKSRFWSNSWLSEIAERAKCQKHLSTTKLSIYDTDGHAPLAIDQLLDVRTTKWQKQLPTTMQCRSHSRRRTIECLFVTACNVDE